MQERIVRALLKGEVLYLNTDETKQIRELLKDTDSLLEIVTGALLGSEALKWHMEVNRNFLYYKMSDVAKLVFLDSKIKEDALVRNIDQIHYFHKGNHLIDDKMSIGELVTAVMNYIKSLEAITEDKSLLVLSAIFASRSIDAKNAILYLIESGCNVNTQDKNGDTALHFATSNGNIGIVDMLLQQSDINICVRDKGGNMPLHCAVSNGHVNVIRILLEYDKKFFNMKNIDIKSAFLLAKFKNHTEIIEILRQHPKFDPRVANEGKEEIFYWAVLNRYLEIVNVLLKDNTLDINAIPSNGKSALHTCLSHGYPEILKALLDSKRVDLGIADAIRPLHLAVSYGHADVVEILLQQPSIDPNVIDEDKNTPIHIAALRDHAKVVEALAKHPKINFGIINVGGRTALRMAIEENNFGAAKQLAEAQSKSSNIKVYDLIKSTLQEQTVKERVGWFGSKQTKLPAIDKSPWEIIAKFIHPSIKMAFLLAAADGKLDIVNALIQNPEIDPNHQDENGKTALHWVAFYDYTEIAEVLSVHRNIDPNIQDKNGRTPLHIAFLRNNIDTAKALLEKNYNKIDPSVKDNDGKIPFLIAVQENLLEPVKIMLSYHSLRSRLTETELRVAAFLTFISENLSVAKELKKYVNFSSGNSNQNDLMATFGFYDDPLKLTNRLISSNTDVNLKTKNANGSTVLQCMIHSGQTEEAKEIISKNPDVDLNIQDNLGNTALHYAILVNDTIVMQELLKSPKVDLDIKENNGITPLRMAIVHCKINLVQLLVEAKSRRCNTNVRTLLRSALSARGTIESILTLTYTSEWIMSKFVYIDGNVDFRLAASEGKSYIIKTLVTNYPYIDPNNKDKNGNTALHLATRNGHLETVSELLKHPKIILDIRDKFGDTPFLLAIKLGHVGIVREFIQYPKLNINIQDKYGDIPLFLAVRYRYVEIINLLLEHAKMDCNVQDKNGDTYLHYAVFHGYIGVIEILLQNAEVDPDIRNNDGKTPLRVAIEMESFGIIQKLVKVLSKRQGTDIRTLLYDELQEQMLIRRVGWWGSEEVNLPAIDKTPEQIIVKFRNLGSAISVMVETGKRLAESEAYSVSK